MNKSFLSIGSFLLIIVFITSCKSFLGVSYKDRWAVVDKVCDSIGMRDYWLRAHRIWIEDARYSNVDTLKADALKQFRNEHSKPRFANYRSTYDFLMREPKGSFSIGFTTMLHKGLFLDIGFSFNEGKLDSSHRYFVNERSDKLPAGDTDSIKVNKVEVRNSHPYSIFVDATAVYGDSVYELKIKHSPNMYKLWSNYKPKIKVKRRARKP